VLSVQQMAFRGFANPTEPTTAELRAWAERPDSVPLHRMPPDLDLLVATERLIATIHEIAMKPTCPARRFGLHCLYIYSADAVRTGFRTHSRRRLKRLVETAESRGDALMTCWAHNTRMLLARPELFNYHDWCEGGLVRRPRRLG
jgi:hypothetical protein